MMIYETDSYSSSDYEDIDESSDDERPTRSDTLVATEQWVHLIEFCSLNSKSKDSVPAGIGVEKLCQATDVNFGSKQTKDNGWIFNSTDREEQLTVSFPTSIFINEIHIYESVNPGSIVKLEQLESQTDKFWTVWQRKTTSKKQAGTHSIFKPLLRRYRTQSNTIRITFDARYTDRIGIQAIKLVGSNIFDESFHFKTLPQSMSKLYEQALCNRNTDVQFRFNDQLVHAHRNILCARSAYFRSLLLNDFAEKHQTKPIELTDIDYETFVEVLYFIYTGTYHPTIPYDIAVNSMIYFNKIDFLSGKNAAIEHICRHLRLNRDKIVSMYCLTKKMSPAFDLLLDYVYDLCSECLNYICKHEDFIELDKESMIDIICRSTERREIRERKQAAQINPTRETSTTDDDDEDE